MEIVNLPEDQIRGMRLEDVSLYPNNALDSIKC